MARCSLLVWHFYSKSEMLHLGRALYTKSVPARGSAKRRRTSTAVLGAWRLPLRRVWQIQQPSHNTAWCGSFLIVVVCSSFVTFTWLGEKKQTRQHITLARRCLRMIHTVRGRGAGGGQLAQAVAIHVKMACHEQMYGLYGASFRKAKRPVSVKFQFDPWPQYRHHTGWIHCARSRDFHK